MNRLLITAVMMGALFLTACGTPSGQTSQGTTTDPFLLAEKGLTTGYATHDGLVRLTIANHESGALVGDNYTTVKGYLDTAKHWLDLAYAANDVVTINADVAQANSAMVSANAKIGGK